MKRLIYQNKSNPNITAEMAYSWVDRIIILEYRKYVKEMKYSDFIKDLTDWELK